MKLTYLYAPIELSFTSGATVDAGTVVQLDTNIQDSIVLYTLDGSLPVEGNFGTFKGEAPVSVEVKATTRIRARAFSRINSQRTTKTLEYTYTVSRTETPIEKYDTTERFYRKLVKSIVDMNFYNNQGWVAPTTQNPLYYVFVNNELFSVRVNFLHNGVPHSVTTFPQLAPGESFEFPVSPSSGENTIEIQTSRVY
jgi:hypothetical protein